MQNWMVWHSSIMRLLPRPRPSNPSGSLTRLLLRGRRLALGKSDMDRKHNASVAMEHLHGDWAAFRKRFWSRRFSVWSLGRSKCNFVDWARLEIRFLASLGYWASFPRIAEQRTAAQTQLAQEKYLSIAFEAAFLNSRKVDASQVPFAADTSLFLDMYLQMEVGNFFMHGIDYVWADCLVFLSNISEYCHLK